MQRSGRAALIQWCVISLYVCFIFTSPVTAHDLTVQGIIQTKEISSLSISPDGRYVAFLVESRYVESNQTKLQWYIARLTPTQGDVWPVASGGVPMRSAFGPVLMQRPQWSKDSRWIYFRKRWRGGVQVWRASRDGRHVQKVTHDEADVDSFVLSRNGKRIYYTVHATRKEIEDKERREYREGVRLTANLEVTQPVLYNFPNGDGTRTTVRRGVTGFYQLLCNGKPKVRVLSLIRPADPYAADVRQVAEYTRLFDSLDRRSGYGWDGRHFGRRKIAFPARRGQELAFWRKPVSKYRWWSDYQLTLKQKNKGHTQTIKCKGRGCRALIGHVSPPRWRPGANEVVWVTASQIGAGTLYGWNVRHGTVRTIYASEARLGGTGGVDRYFETGCPINAVEAVCVSAEATSPPEIVTINLDTGKRQVLFDPNRRLRRQIFEKAKYMTWRDKWGRVHDGVLVLPAGWKKGQRFPLVITSYDCNGFLEGANNRFVPELILAESGFAVLCTVQDDRLELEPYPNRSVGPGVDQVAMQIMLDTWQSGVKALERRDLIYPNRIGVSGLSFSSDTIWYALTHSNLFEAVAVGGPPFLDPFDYFFHGTEGFARPAFRLRDMRDPATPGVMAFYRKASVALNVDKISAPILEQSNSSEYRDGMETYVEMSREKKPYVVYVFPDELHQFIQPDQIAAVQRRNIEWFRFWLQGYEDTSPLLRGQYASWEKLCALQRREKEAHQTKCAIRTRGEGV